MKSAMFSFVAATATFGFPIVIIGNPAGAGPYPTNLKGMVEHFR